MRLFNTKTNQGMGTGSGRNPSSSNRGTKSPSFFKVLVGSFTSKLRIPPAFLKHFHGKLPERSILSSPTGRLWIVKMQKVDNGFFFVDGWETFVKEHSLEFGDFLVFRYNGDSKFKVKIYGRTACEKETASKKEQKSDVEMENALQHDERGKPVMSNNTACEPVRPKSRPIIKNEMKSTNDSYNAGFSCYNVICTPSYRLCMVIPKKFVKDNELLNKGNLQLCDPNGRLWSVGIAHCKDGRGRLFSGWIEFWRGNNMEVGDTCQFKFIKGFGNVYVCGLHMLPRKMVEANGLVNKKSLQLCDPNGKLWTVRLNHLKDGRVTLLGWGELWIGNNFEVGDTFQFKFIDRCPRLYRRPGT